MHTYHARIDVPQALGSTLGLGPPSVQRVPKLEEGLPRGVGERHVSAVHKRDLADIPPLTTRHQKNKNRRGGVTHQEDSGDVAPERARPQQQAAARAHALEVNVRHQPPPHQLEVELQRRARQAAG